MSNILTLNGEFTDALLDKFIENYNKIDKDSPIKIYLSSNGGIISIGTILLDIINNNKENITLVAGGEIMSAAFDLFFFSECKKELLKDTTGMAHYGWTIMSVNENGKPTEDFEKFLLKEMKDNKASNIDKYKELGLTIAELNKIKIGKNCYFNYTRLKELLENGR